MKKHEESRRAFLIGTAVGASAVAGAGLVPNALAQTHEQHNAADVPATTAQGHAHAGGHGAFLNDDDAVTVTAFAERIMPGAPGKPGARDAGVLNYIDLALSGAYSDLQDFYRRGLAALDAHSRTTHGKPFAQLTAAQQDEVITALEGGKANGFTWPTSQAFFETLRTHTMEGMFADPVYGGNKDFAGWVLVGFPGAQPLFSPADLQSRDAFAGAPMIGLERGPRLNTQDFNPHDELRYFQRQDLRPNIKRQPVTWRPNKDTRANPMPVLNNGNQAGGGTVHHGAVSWRMHEDDFRARSKTIERYGASAIPTESSLADWPLSYADLEPFYDR